MQPRDEVVAFPDRRTLYKAAWADLANAYDVLDSLNDPALTEICADIDCAAAKHAFR